MTDYKELDEMRVEIHFKENSVPSIHAGPLTAESKAKLSALLRRVEVEARLAELKKLPITEDEMGWAVGAEIVDARVKELEAER